MFKNAHKLKLCICMYTVPLEAQAHLVGEGVQQQHRLSPGCVDLIPFNRDAWQPTQTKVVDGTKLTAVPANNSAIHSVKGH